MKTTIKILIPLMILGLSLLTRCEAEKKLEPDPLTDIDGNIYGTVFIGNQIWMGENLKTSRLNDGSIITLVSGRFSDREPNRCYYNNDGDSYRKDYGSLYNMYAVYSGKLCPVGWHVPTEDEWTTMINYLGGIGLAGGKLKETGTTHWQSPNYGANNETGFTALPGGQKLMDGTFSGLGYQGHWWIDRKPHGALNVEMFYNYSYAYTQGSSKWAGLSVRCIKDN